jgi:hypothetical protein
MKPTLPNEICPRKQIIALRAELISSLCVFCRGSLYVHLIMNEANNGKDLTLTPGQRKPKRHNAKFCPLVIRERIVNALAAGDSQRAIAGHLRVSPMTVRVIADQEWAQVSARKDRIAAQSEKNATRVAELIAEKLEQKDVPLNVLVPVFGVSVDKALALRGDYNLRIAVDQTHQHIHAHISEASYQELLSKLPRRNTTTITEVEAHKIQAEDTPA